MNGFGNGATFNVQQKGQFVNMQQQVHFGNVGDNNGIGFSMFNASQQQQMMRNQMMLPYG